MVKIYHILITVAYKMNGEPSPSIHYDSLSFTLFTLALLLVCFYQLMYNLCLADAHIL